MRSSLRFASVLFALATLGLTACGNKSNVHEPTPLADISNPALKPDSAWSDSTGGSGDIFSTLRINLQPDALFTADTDGEVYAIKPANGDRIWRTKTKARVVSGPGVFGNLVLVGTLDAEVIALNRADGKELWRSKVSSEVMAPPAGEGHTVVVRTGDGQVHGLAADSGQALWHFDRTEPDLLLRGMSEPLIVGNRVYIGMDNGRAVALALDSGALLWEQAVAVPSGRTPLDRMTDIDAPLMPSGNNIFAVSFGGELAALDGDSGEVAWRRAVKSASGITQQGELVVTTDHNGVVWALDAATGAAVWKQEGLQYRKLSPPAAFAGYVVVGDYQGYLHWLDPKDGKVVGRSRAGRDPIRAQPVAGENLLYVLNTSGKLSAVKAH